MDDVSEYLRTLRRAFTGSKAADYIQIDGWVNQYIRECTNWLLEQGYIRYDKETSGRISDSQYTAMAYRLTDKGRKELEATP